MRSFHAKKGSGEDSYCDTLGYTDAQIEVPLNIWEMIRLRVEFLVIIFYIEMSFYFVGDENISVQELWV